MKIQFQAEIKELSNVLAWILSASRSFGLSEKKLHKIELSSEEALVNIIKHAYQGRPETVEIDIEQTSLGHLEISFKDHGPAFNPLSVEDVNITLPLEDREIGGLGILFIRKSIDELRYARVENKNIFTFVISLSS